mgnify:CR=1 FL=1
MKCEIGTQTCLSGLMAVSYGHLLQVADSMLKTGVAPEQLTQALPSKKGASRGQLLMLV